MYIYFYYIKTKSHIFHIEQKIFFFSLSLQKWQLLSFLGTNHRRLHGPKINDKTKLMSLKNQTSCSTGFEIGCKPVLLMFYSNFWKQSFCLLLFNNLTLFFSGYLTWLFALDLWPIAQISFLLSCGRRVGFTVKVQ